MAQATNTTQGEVVLSGYLSGSADVPVLRASGVTPGTYVPVQRLSVNSKGLVTSIGATTWPELEPHVDYASYVARGITQPGYNINISSAIISVANASSSVNGVFTVQSPLVSTAGVVSVDYNALPVASDTVKGVMQVGSGLAITSGVLRRDVNDASTSVKGLVQVGNNLSVTSGVLSFSKPDATLSTKGVVQISAPLQVSSGVISIPLTSQSELGIARIGTGFNVASGVVSLAYGQATGITAGLFGFNSDFEDNVGNISLPLASTTRQGLMYVGDGLSAASGVVSRSVPDATLSTKGQVQIGSGLAVSSGTVSLNLPNASGSVKGVVQPGTNFTVVSGVLSTNFDDATLTTKGLVQVGTGLTVSGGVMSAALPDATGTVKGIVQIDTSGYLSVSGGVVSASVPDATLSTKGIVQIATNAGLSISSGVLTSQVATDTLKGVATAGSGLSVSGGTLSFTVADATLSTKGIVQPSSSFFDVTAGTWSVLPASGTTQEGIVVPANTQYLTISAGGALDVGALISKLDTSGTFTKAQVSALQTETFAASFAPDFSKSNTYEMVLTGNMTLENPTNAVAGGVYNIILTQDGTGSRTLTIAGSGYKTNQTITLSTAAGKRDVLTLVYKSSSEIFVLFAPGF